MSTNKIIFDNDTLRYLVEKIVKAIPTGKNGLNGADGHPGEDGFSPTVSIEEGTGTHTIIIEDRNGPKRTTIRDGKDGSGGEDKLVTNYGVGTYLNLTQDKYQTTNFGTSSTINFPSVSSFKEIHLFFKTSQVPPVLSFSSCKWQNGKAPKIESNKQYELIFTTLTGSEWLGGVVVYG